MSFPVEYTPPGKYPTLTDDQLVATLCALTQDVINLRSDLANLSAQWNSQFFRVFMESHGESVAGRNRLAENFTVQLTNEKVECEANIAANEDLCSLIRLILDYRRTNGRQERVGSSSGVPWWHGQVSGQTPLALDQVEETPYRSRDGSRQDPHIQEGGVT